MVVKCQEVPVFHPTLRDVNGSWEAYIESIERRFAHVGLAKIVPPKGWTPRKAGYSDDFDFPIPRPIRQHATGKRGLYRTLLVEQRPMSLAKDFRPQAVEDESLPPAKETPEEVERRFWRNVNLRPPLYGADVPGSLFDEDLKGWNLRRLDSMLSRTLDKNKVQIPGVSTPFLYFGMWRSIFAWHTEDMDLASVNYLHCGAPKAWYCIPPAHRERFERLLEGLLPDMFRACPEFFRHKELLVSPYLLLQNNIPVVRCTQFPGEFIINYPGAYHSGFNHGFNCAESTNFATKSWLPIGVQAGYCDCQKDSVAIQMSLFMQEASPRVQRMIREAEASTTVEEDSDCDTDSDASTGETDESDESEAESEVEAAPKPRGRPKKAVVAKATKVAAKEKKPVVRGGRGMTACVKPVARKAAAPAERKAKPAAAKSPAPRRPASRKPVGTPARAAGKRAASIPVRLRPLDNTPYKRTQAQAGARAAYSKPGPKPGQKRSPATASLRTPERLEPPKRQKLEAARDRQGRTRSCGQVAASRADSDAAEAAAAKRAQRPATSLVAARKQPPRSSEQQVTVLRRVLKLTVKAAEAMSKGAVNFLGGNPRSLPVHALANGAIVPACATRSSVSSPAAAARGSDKQGNGPYLPPRAGAIRKPTAQFPSLQTVPRRPRTRPDYSKIITASCEQACCSPDGPRCRTRPVEQRPVHRRDPSLRA